MSRYKFGAFVLDSESRVLLKDDRPVPTTGKILDLLVLLVERHGNVVDKDDLLSQLWPGTVVEEANLTQGVFTLRKILGDNPKDHRYIATVAGRGYQFVARVVEVPDEPTPLTGKDHALSTEPRGTRVMWTGAVSGLLVLLAAALWFWAGARGRAPAVQAPKTMPFTTLGGMVLQPAFSPDGKQIAYSWLEWGTASFSIFVKMTGSETHLRLTKSPGWDNNPAWSPDGTRIVFYRTLLGASGYYVVSALGGALRQILRTDIGWRAARAAWFPDGRRLVIVQPTVIARNSGVPFSERQLQLVSLDIATGQQTVLTSPPEDGRTSDSQPVFSPDGTTLAFVREAAYTFNSEIYLMPVGGKPHRWASPGPVSGLDWTADGREIVYSLETEPENGLWRMPIDGPPAQRIASSMDFLTSPTVARGGDRLAYAVETMHETFWHVELSGSDPPKAGLPTRAIYSTRFQMGPMYSPDGHRVAFDSDRSGTDAIWVSDPDGRDSLQVTHAADLYPGSPSWSPDGSLIAFDARLGGKPEIYVVPAEGGDPRCITRSQFEDIVPGWSRDGKWIYFASNRSGDFQIWRVPAAAGESPTAPAIQVTQGGGLNAVESRDGKYLYFAKGRGKTGLWRKELTTGLVAREEPVLESLPYWGWWTLGSRGIFFLEFDRQPKVTPALKYLDLASKRITTLFTLSKPVDWQVRVITVSPDGHHLIYETYDDLQHSNIVLVEGFR
jgi:Tol biopolymer transport system component/DNA-binding winged helix-turn-helix (wHTH) protein